MASAAMLHTQCADDPHPCFACKCRYWREHGMNLAVPQEWTSRPTVREQEKQALADAKASGRQFDLADDRYRHF